MATSVKYEEFHSSTRLQTKIINENNFTYRLLLESINKYIKPENKVLDIGCGVGALDLYLASKGYEVLGIDISKHAVESARDSAEAMGFKNAKFEKYDFPSETPKGKFDFIIFTEVIEHIKEDRKALSQINKLLNKYGILLLSTPSIQAPLHRIGYAKEFDKRVGHLRRYDLENLYKMIEANGFKILETRKVEGILRNFLFFSPGAGKLVRFIKGPISNFVTLIDNILVGVFRESNYIIIAKKI